MYVCCFCSFSLPLLLYLHMKLCPLSLSFMPQCSPQGLVLGLALLFSVLVNDLHSGIEGNFSTFATDTRLCGTADTMEGRDAIQEDLDRFEKWTFGKYMKFKKETNARSSPWVRAISGTIQAGQRMKRDSPKEKHLKCWWTVIST